MAAILHTFDIFPDYGFKPVALICFRLCSAKTLSLIRPPCFTVLTYLKHTYLPYSFHSTFIHIVND